MKTLKIFLLVLLILAILAGSLLLLRPLASNGENYNDSVVGDTNLPSDDNLNDNIPDYDIDDIVSYRGYSSSLPDMSYIEVLSTIRLLSPFSHRLHTAKSSHLSAFEKSCSNKMGRYKDSWRSLPVRFLYKYYPVCSSLPLRSDYC